MLLVISDERPTFKLFSIVLVFSTKVVVFTDILLIYILPTLISTHKGVWGSG